MAEKFDPFKTGALYNRHKRRWELEQFVSEATLDQLESGEWLPRFSDKEAQGDYDHRKSMSAPLDLCRDGVQMRVDNLWRTPPKREVSGPHKAIIETLLHDADTAGTDLDKFMQRVAWQYYVTGADVVAQMDAAPEGVEIRTEADVQIHGIRPYFILLNPLQRYDWACNGGGGLQWVRYCLGDKPPADEQEAQDEKRVKVTEFLTLTRNQWQRHTATRRSENTNEGERGTVDVQTNSGPHGLGKPPVVCVYYADSHKADEPGVPLSLLTRPAVVAKVLLNLKSQADADLLAALPRWCATGIPADQAPDAYAAGMLVVLPSPEASMTVVQGNVGHIEEKRKWVELYILEIMRLLKFWGGTGSVDKARQGSGIRLALERTELDNELRSTADFLESVELEMMRQAVLLARPNEQIAPHEAADKLGYSVQYNRDFVLEPVAQLLESMKAWVGDCGFVADDWPAITQEIGRQIVNALMREGTDEYEEAMEQIEKNVPEKPEPPQIPPQIVSGKPPEAPVVPEVEAKPKQPPPKPTKRRRKR